ncbi:dihydrofolate reductase family protein [Enterococcus dispar]|uniref:dihydrofolate reductase family protein n=1 Tax=Enterococcus dispar TaxID=44009 RepID=UPI00189DF391|nr:dihydrofolate reductase family protein [Enterococcus dispar]WCG34110.1 dihydrofolate reductase family protein [Enterococcus dispar]
MAKVVFYGAISLDGYLADNADSLQWLFDTNLAGVSTYENFEENVAAVVMGRVTYDEVIKLLNGQILYPHKQKIIFSRSRTDEIDEGYFTAQDPNKVIVDLKTQVQGYIWIVGGGELLTHLMAADLLDEYWIQIAPVFLGNGKRLFPTGDYQQRLDFVDSTTMGEMVELHYRKKME